MAITKQKILENKSLIGKFLLLNLFIFVVYSAYIYFVGVPLTKAQNYYDRAIRFQQRGAIEEAKQAINESLLIWYTTKADTLKQKLNQSN